MASRRRRAFRLAGAILLGLAAPLAAQAPDARLDVAIQVGGDDDLDACGTLGAVTGLDPRGDNFLSVRSGPGGRPYREVDRVGTGQELAICEERGVWLGVVYARQGDAATECRLSAARPRRAAYDGPFRSGWVHRRYVRIVAG